jgi:hypothetical protein
MPIREPSFSGFGSRISWRPPRISANIYVDLNPKRRSPAPASSVLIGRVPFGVN